MQRQDKREKKITPPRAATPLAAAPVGGCADVDVGGGGAAAVWL